MSSKQSSPSQDVAGQDSLISVCIPTYKRPGLLREALESCLAQTWSYIEIVIGDDSPDDLTEELVAEYVDRYPGRILYKHHRPAQGQNGNVNDLFARANGGRLLLLHDDDLLVPEAANNLARLWEQLPTLDAAFGKQRLMEQDGTLAAPERNDSLNASYARTAANAGRQPSPIVAGILRMFPNDGFLVNTALARRIGYRPMSEVGHACDTDFGLRLCAAARDIWFLDEFTVNYRVSEESISKHSTVTPYTYDMLSSLAVPPAVVPVVAKAKRDIAASAVSGFSRLGKTQRALTIYFSPDYPLKQRLTPRGLYHFLLILKSVPQKPVVERRQAFNPAQPPEVS